VREEVHTGFWWGNLRERDHMGDPAVNVSIFEYIIKTDI